MLRVEVAFFFGLIVTCPIWLYQLWAFVAPGLYRREKQWTYAVRGHRGPAVRRSAAALAYFAMSRGLRYLLGLAPRGRPRAAQRVHLPRLLHRPCCSASGWPSSCRWLLLMLNMVGILTPRVLQGWRRLMIFAVFVFAGIASPSPDPLTMLLLAVPCVVLVEIAEVIIWANDRRRAARPSMYAGLADDEAAAA